MRGLGEALANVKNPPCEGSYQFTDGREVFFKHKCRYYGECSKGKACPLFAVYCGNMAPRTLRNMTDITRRWPTEKIYSRIFQSDAVQEAASFD